MHQALTRRFSRLKEGEGKMPDILLVDGGKGQLAMAQDVLQELSVVGLILLGVAKGVTRKPGLETLYLNGRRTRIHPAGQLAGAAPDPADPRRIAPLRHHRPPRPTRQGSTHLQPGRSGRRGAEAPA